MSLRSPAERSSYRSPGASAEAELREKGSRFLARLEGAVDEAGARAVLAYAGAARQAVTGARFVERLPMVSFRISTSYDKTGSLQRLLAIPGVRLAEQDFGERVEMVVEVDVPAVEVFESAVADLAAVVAVERIFGAGAT